MKQGQLLTLVALGVGGYFLWDYYKKQQTPTKVIKMPPTNGATPVLQSGATFIDAVNNFLQTAFPKQTKAPTQGPGYVEQIAGCDIL